MIANLDDLKSAMAEWLMREDQATIDAIPAFIDMAEAQFNRLLRTKEMTRRATTTAADRYLRLPSDWVEARNVQRNDSGAPLEFKSMPEMDKIYSAYLRQELDPTGPMYYGYVGLQMELMPPPTGDSPIPLELTYYGRIPPLTDEEPVNWLLQWHPDIYLYTALVHSAPFLKDDSRVTLWQGIADRAMLELENANQRASTSGGTMSRPLHSLR